MAAAEQVKALLGRSPTEAPIPVFVFDAGYDPVKLQQGIGGSACQILVRLRAGRCFYADPSLAERPANPGRPRRHGPKMKSSDPRTWSEPSMDHECEDTGYGAVRVRAWTGACTRRSGRTKDGEAEGPCRSWSGRSFWSR
jgi:DDE superfamily endonuclease